MLPSLHRAKQMSMLNSSNAAGTGAAASRPESRPARAGRWHCRPFPLEDHAVIPLDLPVPPQLEAAVGLPDTPARFFAVYWQPCGDEACYDNGRSSGTGNWTGYLAYVRHPAVAL